MARWSRATIALGLVALAPGLAGAAGAARAAGAPVYWVLSLQRGDARDANGFPVCQRTPGPLPALVAAVQARAKERCQLGGVGHWEVFCGDPDGPVRIFPSQPACERQERDGDRRAVPLAARAWIAARHRCVAGALSRLVAEYQAEPPEALGRRAAFLEALEGECRARADREAPALRRADGWVTVTEGRLAVALPGVIELALGGEPGPDGLPPLVDWGGHLGRARFHLYRQALPPGIDPVVALGLRRDDLVRSYGGVVRADASITLSDPARPGGWPGRRLEVAENLGGAEARYAVRIFVVGGDLYTLSAMALGGDPDPTFFASVAVRPGG